MLIFVLFLAVLAAFAVGWRLVLLFDMPQPAEADWTRIGGLLVVLIILVFAIGSIFEKVLP